MYRNKVVVAFLIVCALVAAGIACWPSGAHADPGLDSPDQAFLERGRIKDTLVELSRSSSAITFSLVADVPSPRPRDRWVIRIEAPEAAKSPPAPLDFAVALGRLSEVYKIESAVPIVETFGLWRGRRKIRERVIESHTTTTEMLVVVEYPR